MKHFLIALLLSSYTFAASLLSLTTSDEGGKVNILLSFDAQFDGSIEQSMSPKGPLLNISDITVEAKKEITFKSGAVKRIVLSKESPSRASLLVESDEPLTIDAQKSNDNQKLEFIVSSSANAAKKDTPYDKSRGEQFSKSFSEKFDQNRNVKPESDFYWRYVVVIAFMAFLLIILIIVKKYYAGKQAALKAKNAQDANSLREFSSRGEDRRKGAPVPEDKAEIVERGVDRRRGADPYNDFASPHNFDRHENSQRRQSSHHDEELNIVSQKSIDDKNKLVAVEYDGDRYLLLIGPNSTIMDKTATDKKAKEFEDTFLGSGNRLENHLKTKQLSKFDLYKARAEGD